MVTIRSVALTSPTRIEQERTHLAVDVHRAGAALRDAAAVFGAGEADLLADDPQQRRIGLHLHVTDLAIDVELCHAPPHATGSAVEFRRRGSSSAADSPMRRPP